MKTINVILVLLFILLPVLSKADVSGKIIAFNCHSCHGKRLKNIYQSKLPSKAHLIRTLLAFKQDEKQVTIMNRIAKGYSDRELAAVAGYLKGAE